MLPHVRDRPLTCTSSRRASTSGATSSRTPRALPRLGRHASPCPSARAARSTHVLRQRAATLVYLAGQNVITPHLWSSRVDKLELPRPHRLRPRPLRRRASTTSAPPRARPATPCATSACTRSRWSPARAASTSLAPLRRTADYDRVRAFARDAGRGAGRGPPRQAHARAPDREARRPASTSTCCATPTASTPSRPTPCARAAARRWPRRCAGRSSTTEALAAALEHQDAVRSASTTSAATPGPTSAATPARCRVRLAPAMAPEPLPEPLTPDLPDVPGVRHLLVEVEGVRLHVAEAGEGDPVVLQHGWPEHWYAWRHVIPKLARTRRVIAPDLRGFGWSEAPAAVREGDLRERPHRPARRARARAGRPDRPRLGRLCRLPRLPARPGAIPPLHRARDQPPVAGGRPGRADPAPARDQLPVRPRRATSGRDRAHVLDRARRARLRRGRGAPDRAGGRPLVRDAPAAAAAGVGHERAVPHVPDSASSPPWSRASTPRAV